MLYIFSIFMLLAGYYSLTYGISLWKDDDNKLGGLGAIIIAIIGTIAPIVVMFIKL